MIICLLFIRNNVSWKKLTSFCAERTYADLTEEYNNMELKSFRKVRFLVKNFFFRFDWLKMKTKFEIITATFHPKLFTDEIFDITD